MTATKKVRRLWSALVRVTRGVESLPPDFSAEVREVIRRVRPFTMTSPERIFATCSAVEHVVRFGVKGALVECGVWRGGNVLAMILTLQRLGVMDRDIYLYDTFDGMTAPTDVDRDLQGTFGRDLFKPSAIPNSMTNWLKCSVARVRSVVQATGYPGERLHFVQGPVESTVPSQSPSDIAVLRLDTDWYASTRHELHHLYPRLSRGGVLIIDDYGHWQGARQAVDEYFAGASPRIFLSRVDYSARIGVKE
jgi:O-methyltransferase